MKNKQYTKELLLAGFIAAFAYSIVAGFYVRAYLYSAIWMLYLGNFLFAFVIGVFLFWFCKRHERELYILQLLVSGGKASAAGIAMACLGCLLLLLLFMPSVVQAFGKGHFSLRQAPAQLSGPHKGYANTLFINAVIGNAAAAFFITIMLSFTLLSRNRQPL